MSTTKICCNYRFYKNSTHYCRCLEMKISCNDSCDSFEFSKPIDWLLSGDDGEESFHERLKADLEELKPKKNDRL